MELTVIYVQQVHTMMSSTQTAALTVLMDTSVLVTLEILNKR